jgi:hypothetical protein
LSCICPNCIFVFKINQTTHTLCHYNNSHHVLSSDAEAIANAELSDVELVALDYLGKEDQHKNGKNWHG